jgi:histidinol phosphatase-like enzyme
MLEENSNYRKIAFIDRDGVINKKPAEQHYVLNINEFIINDGIFSFIENSKIRWF